MTQRTPSIMKNLAPTDAAALEAVETREWLESLDYVLDQGDKGRVDAAARGAARPRARSPASACRSRRRRRTSTRSRRDEQVPIPGDREIERRIKSLVRWNALAMVVRANRESDGIGGHISTYASAATLYEVGVQPLLPRQGRRRATPTSSTTRATRRRASTRARSSKAGSTETAPARTSATSCAPERRPVVVSASVADAGLLGVPDGLDGPRPADGDLPGAVRRATWRTAASSRRPTRRSGRSSATAKRTSRKRSARSRSRRARSSTT